MNRHVLVIARRALLGLALLSGLLDAQSLALQGERSGPQFIACRNDGPHVDDDPAHPDPLRANGLKAMTPIQIDADLVPSTAAPFLVADKFFDNSGSYGSLDTAFTPLMLFNPDNGHAQFRRDRWIGDENHPPVGFSPSSWIFNIAGGTNEIGSRIVLSGNFTGTSQGSELFFYRPNPSPPGHVSIYSNSIGTSGISSPTFVLKGATDGSNYTFSNGWTVGVAGHFIAGAPTTVFLFRPTATQSTAGAIVGYVPGSTPQTSLAVYSVVNPAGTVGTDIDHVLVGEWTNVASGHFYPYDDPDTHNPREGANQLDDLLFYNTENGHWSLQQVRTLPVGTLHEVLSSDGTGVHPPFFFGYNGMLSGEFGSSFRTVCMYDTLSSKVYFAHPNQPDVFFFDNLFFEGEDVVIKEPFSALAAGQFAVTNPENVAPTEPGYGTLRPDDLKWGDRNYADVVCYQPASVTSPPVLNYWRYRPGNEYVRARVEGYTRPADGRGDSVAAGSELEFHLSSNAATSGGNVVEDILSINVTRKGDPDIQMPGTIYALAGPQPSDEHPMPEDPFIAGCNWPVSAKMRIPADWPSGLYVATVVSGAITEPGDPTNFCNCHCKTDIAFVVRPADGHYGAHTNILCVVQSNTYQAYNFWGGRCLYGHGFGARYTDDGNGHVHDPYSNTAGDVVRPNAVSPGDGTHVGENHGWFFGGTPDAFKVSFDRPYHCVADAFPNIAEYPAQNYCERPYLQYWEVPFIQWCDRHGIRLDFCTGADIDRDPNILVPGATYNLVLSVGHDEYWSYNMKHRIQNFVAAGGNAAFFSANTCWWQIRYENEPDNGARGANTGRRITCYKSQLFDPGVFGADGHVVVPSTTQWSWYGYRNWDIPYSPYWVQDGAVAVPAGGPEGEDPETNLTGISYVNGAGGWAFFGDSQHSNALQLYKIAARSNATHDWILRNPTTQQVPSPGTSFGAYTFTSQNGASHPRTIIGWETDAVVPRQPPANAGPVTVLAEVRYSPDMRSMIDSPFFRNRVLLGGGFNNPDGDFPAAMTAFDDPGELVGPPWHPRLATMSAFTHNNWNGNADQGEVKGTTFASGTMDWVFGLSLASANDGLIDNITLNVLTTLGRMQACTSGTIVAEGIPLQSNIWQTNPVIITARVKACGSLVPTSATVLADVDQVSADGASTGGFVTLHNDGANGDATASDNIFSATIHPRANLASGPYSLQIKVNGVIQDSTIDVVVDDVGDAKGTAKMIQRTGVTTYVDGQLGPNDVDVFHIAICQNNGEVFTASTLGSGLDTQLFLFDENMFPIACNDDISDTVLQSYLAPSSSQLHSGSTYYLAITSYNKDPVGRDGSTTIDHALFPDTLTGQVAPFCVRNPADPDDPCMALFRFRTGGLGAGTGAYTVAITGLCTSSNCADFDCNGDVGTDADIEAFFACLAGTCPTQSMTCHSSADFNHDGDVGTDADVEAFFRALAGGPC